MTEKSMVRTMCGVQKKARNRSTDLMFMLGLKETMDQLAMAISVHWYGHVLRREDAHVLRRALDFEVEGERKKGWPERTRKRMVDKESMKDGLRRKDALCHSKWNVGLTRLLLG